MDRLRSHNAKQNVSVRKMALELLEPRQLLAAAPLTLGIVFVEGDTGTDRDGDVFEVAFHGGAPGTTLQRMVISGDRDRNGFGEGDVIFDPGERTGDGPGEGPGEGTGEGPGDDNPGEGPGEKEPE